jgi:asparagine synthase (glutamine-hydrolysing)
MFRYVALSWDTRSASATSTASSLLNEIRGDTGLRQAFDGPGLQLLTAGEQGGINEVLPLADGRGVILGKVFDRDARAIPADHFALRPDESAAAVHSAGRLLVEKYWGRYVAFIASRHRGWRVLRDARGGLPCFRVQHHGVDIVFSWLEGILRSLISLPLPGIAWDCVAAHLAFGSLNGRPTALEGITQVLPGEAVPVGGDEAVSQLLWTPTACAGAEPIDDVPAACDALRGTVRRCVQAWAGTYPALVLRLSGGLDSSILASCLAADQIPVPVTCLNYHSPGADSDERAYARLAAQRAGRELVELRRTEDFTLEQILDLALTPGPVSYTGRFVTRMDMEVARLAGAPAMFTGAGGDQLFFEFQRWWPAADYLRMRGIDAGLPAALMNAARLGKVSLWRALRNAAADRLRKRMPPPPIDRPWSLATESVWATLSEPARYAHPAASDPAGLPIGKLMQVLQLLQVGAYYDPWHPETAPETVHPLLSQPLVELCLRIPTYLLTLHGRARGLAREAFAADLPVEIVNRRSKGGLQEVIQTILDRNLGLARQLVLEGQLASRGLIDRQRAEVALSAAAGPGSVKPGEIHLYIAVEAWLRRHASLQADRR